MATAMGISTGYSSSSPSWMNNLPKNKKKNKNVNRVVMSSVSTVADPYKTLRISRSADEAEVKKAFRRLALQYHPDVYKGQGDSSMKFHEINEAYDAVITNLRERSRAPQTIEMDEETLRMYEEDDLWEEYMGWEGAGIRDYSAFINPFI